MKQINGIGNRNKYYQKCGWQFKKEEWASLEVKKKMHNHQRKEKKAVILKMLQGPLSC
jgi:hypothetical protein